MQQYNWIKSNQIKDVKQILELRVVIDNCCNCHFIMALKILAVHKFKVANFG